MHVKIYVDLLSSIVMNTVCPNNKKAIACNVVHISIPVVDITSPKTISRTTIFGATTSEPESPVFIMITVIGKDTWCLRRLKTPWITDSNKESHASVYLNICICNIRSPKPPKLQQQHVCPKGPFFTCSSRDDHIWSLQLINGSNTSPFRI